MKITITKNQLDTLKENFRKKNDDRIAPVIRKCLELVYKPKGYWGKIENPENNCETEEGVINIYPHLEGVDMWSILNRFDTNTLVRDKIKEKYLSENPGIEYSENKFIDWIEGNKEQLFDSEFTKTLIDLNKGTIESGNRNEQYTIDILKDHFGTSATIKRFCSGDKRDTKLGMDLSVEINGNHMSVQVKPFQQVRSLIDSDSGENFFAVKTFLNYKKYSEKNVDIFFFVNFDRGEYISFLNERRRIKQGESNELYFFEPFLMSNIDFKGKTKEKSYRNIEKQQKVKDVFRTSERRLENLMFKKQALEDLIAKEIEKINNLKSQG